MNESLGCGLTLRRASLARHASRRPTHNGSPIQEGDIVVAFSGGQEELFADTVEIPLHAVDGVNEFLQSDRYRARNIEGIGIEQIFDKEGAACPACTGNKAPRHDSVYGFTQYLPQKGIRQAVFLHSSCVPPFLEALESVWEYTDTGLADEL